MGAYSKAQGVESNKDDKVDNQDNRLGIKNQETAQTKTNSPRYNQQLNSA